MHKTKSNPKVSINVLPCNINVYENLYNLECFGPIYNQKKKKKPSFVRVFITKDPRHNYNV